MSVKGTYGSGTPTPGVSSVFQTCDIVAHIHPPPDGEYLLMTFFGFLVIGPYFMEKIAERVRT
jgi:hypothetical protein